MKKLCASGYKLRAEDRKALEDSLVVTPKKWCDDALEGMKSKAIGSIMKDWFDLYKSKQVGDIPSDYSVIITGIIAMDEFKPYNIDTPKDIVIETQAVADEEIWPDGFDVQDYEDLAMRAYYSNPEEMLCWFMTNKIYLRRKAFIKYYEKSFFDREEAIPPTQDAYINAVCDRIEYLNRAEREA